ncbi:MAG: SHOCT domain-containing protein [Patescibacteria group bacterium]
MYTFFTYNYGVLGLIIFILIWIIIIGVVIEIVRAIIGPAPRPQQPATPPAPQPPVMPVATIHTTGAAPKTPLEILNERYAKGEINKDEYDQKKLDITRAHTY